MLSIKLLSNVEVFLCFLVLFFGFFFDPHALLFILAFQGLHCCPAFEIDLLYVILCHVFSYLLHFLYQHTQSFSASLCYGIVEP